jgi:hypothetical protein
MRTVVPVPAYLAFQAIFERSAEAGDVNPEAALLHNHIGPDSRHQFLVADDFPGAFDQRDQNVQGTAATLDRRSVPQQAPFGCK